MAKSNGGGGRSRRGGGSNDVGARVLSPVKKGSGPVNKTGKTTSTSVRQAQTSRKQPSVINDAEYERRAKNHEDQAKRYHTQARSAARQDQRLRKKGDTAGASASGEKKKALDAASNYHKTQAHRQRQLSNAI